MIPATTPFITDQQIEEACAPDEELSADHVRFLLTLMSQYNNDMPAIMQRFRPFLRNATIRNDYENLADQLYILSQQYEEMFSKILVETNLGKSAEEVAVLIRELLAEEESIEHLIDYNRDLIARDRNIGVETAALNNESGAGNENMEGLIDYYKYSLGRAGIESVVFILELAFKSGNDINVMLNKCKTAIERACAWDDSGKLTADSAAVITATNLLNRRIEEQFKLTIQQNAFGRTNEEIAKMFSDLKDPVEKLEQSETASESKRQRMFRNGM